MKKETKESEKEDYESEKERKKKTTIAILIEYLPTVQKVLLKTK